MSGAWWPQLMTRRLRKVVWFLNTVTPPRWEPIELIKWVEVNINTIEINLSVLIFDPTLSSKMCRKYLNSLSYNRNPISGTKCIYLPIIIIQIYVLEQTQEVVRRLLLWLWLRRLKLGSLSHHRRRSTQHRRGHRRSWWHWHSTSES